MNEQVAKAYRFAEEKHKGQMRRFTGKEYFVHPVAVSKTIEDLTKDPVLIQVALLHDVVEDTNTTIEEVEENFGGVVAGLVYQLTETAEKRGNMSKVEYLTKEINEISPAALTVKLADRLDNIQCLKEDYQDKSFPSFVDWYHKQTVKVLLTLAGAEFTKAQSILMGMLAFDLDYILIKHGL